MVLHYFFVCGEMPYIVHATDISASRNRPYNKFVTTCMYVKNVNILQGDSGGPMSIGNEIYGVTSWGVVSCSPARPSVYSRVAAFQPWVCAEAGGEPEGC